MSEQYLLRVKRGSDFEKFLAAGNATYEEFEEILGNKGARKYVNRFPKWFDNVITEKSTDGATVRYTNVMPTQVQVVTSDVNFEGASVGTQLAEGELESKMVWPLAPPMVEKMENFDKPSWYEDMKLMVRLGRHIAIEGPPSIGKDTAVEQLAAEEGAILVTIGGDGGFRTRDLTGGQQMVNGTSFFDVGEYVAAAVNGWWVLLTEVNAADPSALMYINRQLAAPYVANIGGKSFPVHPNFRIFVTYNHGLVGTKPLPQSFKDRFFSIKESFFTKHQLTKRLGAMGMSSLPAHERDNAIIVDYGIAMWEAHTSGKMRYQITTRRLKDAIDLVVVGGYDVRKALKAAVINAIDSPIEAKVAEDVLKNVISLTSEEVKYVDQWDMRNS